MVYAHYPLAADASVAARYLASRPEIDSARVGLWGRSQGAWVAPLAASQLEHVAFVVLVVGGGVPVLDQQLFQSKAMLRRLGLNEADLQAVLLAQRALTTYYNSPDPAALQSEAQDAMMAIREREWFDRLPLRVVVDSRKVPPPAWVITHREGSIRPLSQARFDPAVPEPITCSAPPDQTATWRNAHCLPESRSSCATGWCSNVSSPPPQAGAAAANSHETLLRSLRNS